MSDYGFDFRNDDFPSEFAEANPLALAQDLIAREQARSALELLSRHSEDFVDHPQYLILCARAWTSLADFARAQHALLEAVRLAPADPTPLVLLAELLLERGELQRAHRVLSKARDLAPTNPAAARLLRRLREQRSLVDPGHSEDDPSARASAVEAGPEDLIAAAQEAERARQEAPKPPRPLARRLGAAGLLLVVAGLTVAGLWRQSPAESPGTVADFGPEEDLLSTAGLAPEARLPVPSAFERLPSPIRPEGSEPSAEPIGRPTKSTLRESSAREFATLPWKQLSRDPVALVARADQLYELGRRRTAASLYRRALRLRPDYPAAIIGVSRSLMHAKNTRAAMSLATRVIEADVPKTAATEAMALYLVGRIHYERGERVSARRLLREATTLPDAPPEAWFYLGETLSRDNSPAARQAYEQYLRAVSSGPLVVRARKAIR